MHENSITIDNRFSSANIFLMHAAIAMLQQNATRIESELKKIALGKKATNGGF
jgi:hypothetical protein